jgi:hypothetical protein
MTMVRRVNPLLRPPLRPSVEGSYGLVERAAKGGERVVLTVTTDQTGLCQFSQSVVQDARRKALTPRQE